MATKRHSVTIAVAHHDYWTAAGELVAHCQCGWWDHYSYLPGGKDFAVWKLQCRATDHVRALIHQPA